MRDRARLERQAGLAKAHILLRAKADQDLLEAQQEETQRRDALRKSQGEADEAAGDWAVYLARGDIEPLQLGRLARTVMEKDEALHRADGAVTKATDLTLKRRLARAESDVREKQSKRALQRLRKELAHASEEDAAASLSDFITYRETTS